MSQILIFISGISIQLYMLFLVLASNDVVINGMLTCLSFLTAMCLRGFKPQGVYDDDVR